MRSIKHVFAVGLLALASVGSIFAAPAAEAENTVKLTYVNWEEGVAYSHLAAAILDEELGYTVELTAADVGPAFASVAAGDHDFFMEAWLPNLHAIYVDQYPKLVDVATIYQNGVVGLIVPQYMADAGITKLSDLARPEVADQLDRKITGIDAGAGMMIKTSEELMPLYGLDDLGYELIASSGPAMIAALAAAIENQEYIVAMGWQPHSMFGRYELAILEQDLAQIWDVDDIHILGRPGVEKDLPYVVEFFQNMELTNEIIGPLMVYIADSDLDTMAAAREWKAANESIWRPWLSSE